MSISAIASLRPLHGLCLRHSPTAVLAVRIQTKSTNLQLRALVDLRPARQFRRCQSTSPSSSDKAPSRLRKSAQKPQVTFGQVLRRALLAGFRNLAFAFSPRGIKQGYRDHPFSTVATLVLFVLFFSTAVPVLYRFYHAFYNPQVNRYPKPIANTLRRALLHAFYRPDPELALKFFKKAMTECSEHGLDPFSDEVLGIRIIIAQWLEKIRNYQTAIEVLEQLLGDCNKWVEVFEQTVKAGKVTPEGRLKAITDKAGDGAESDTKKTDPPVESLWHQRQRLLNKAVATSVKLGELYADDHILDTEKSHERLVWAVETSLKEFQRRRTEGLHPGEEKVFMSPEEMGGSMESLGRNYERKSQFQLAIPLFFQALRLCENPCHRAVIMNNLAACFAQQPLLTTPGGELSETLGSLFTEPLPTTREESLEAAKNWCKNAYVHANDVKGSERTEECDHACVAALCNWGDVAAMMGKREVAHKKYKQSIEIARKLGLVDGVKQAQQGLAKMGSAPASGS